MPSLTASLLDHGVTAGTGALDRTVIDLRDVDIRRLAEATIEDAGRGSTPFGSYLFTSTEPAAELARHVERVVLAESFGCSAEVATASYHHYEPASFFVCILDHRRRLPVGAVRIVLPGPYGFKSFDEIERHWHQSVEEVLARTNAVIDRQRTWDVATLMVCPGYRNGTVSQALHQAVCTAATHAGVQSFITILDLAVLRLLQLRLRRIFSHYDGVEAKYYEGSPSLPVWSDLVPYRHRLQASHPDLYETIFEGRNLEGAVSAPDWDDALQRVGASATARAG